MIWRYRLSLGLEAVLWTLATGWLVFLVADVVQSWRAMNVVAWRSLYEIALLALLVYWPIIRVRIVHGYWMRDWNDAPQNRSTDVDQGHQNTITVPVQQARPLRRRQPPTFR